MAGRPREFDRDEALERARDAFWERGYEGTSMADLVQAMGLASARIYAAFGSKEALFREAVALYEAGEGGFATRALKEEPSARRAIERMLRDAAEVFTKRGTPRGCMVVSGATNCASENDPVMKWLARQRRAGTRCVVQRLRAAMEAGELKPDTDVEALGGYFSAFMHGLAIQARDGASKKQLLALIPSAMRALDAASA